MKNIHDITKQFEQAICDYTGAPYACCVDNMSNALYLALCYEGIKGKTITIPSHTYPSVPNEIIRAGGRVNFAPSDKYLTGAYCLKGSRTIDSALFFSADMYIEGSFMCISFTGAYKTLKLSKGGAILFNDKDARDWFIRARNSGRGECSYHDDEFTMLGINCYMMPEIATRGLLLIQQFYNLDGTKKYNEPITLPYPDLSKFEIYKSDTFL